MRCNFYKYERKLQLVDVKAPTETGCNFYKYERKLQHANRKRFNSM